MPCKKLSELVNEYGSNWQSSVIVNDGPFLSDSLCVEYCGICCVPQCGWPASFSTTYASVPGGFPPGGCCATENWICGGSATRSLTVSQTNPNYFGSPATIPWKPGYPAALPADWRWIESVENRSVGLESLPSYPCICLGDTREWDPVERKGCLNVPPGESAQGRQLYQEITFKRRLFGCINGIMIDITEDALFVDQYLIPANTYSFRNIPFNWLDNKIIYAKNQWPEYITPNTFFTIAYKVNEGDFENPGAFFEFSDWPFQTQDRPPLPNEGSASGIIYTCNDTITQSGCLFGGVLNPSGTQLGIWVSGQDCTTFDCNA